MIDRYAVVGNPIAHSRSPAIHTEFARQTGQCMSYEALLAPLDQFEQVVREFFANGGKGLNITLPFKPQAFDFADALSERASSAGAVNTLKLLDDGRIWGDNTDGAGLVQDLLVNCGQQIKSKRILMLGAGGAARGAMLPLLLQKPAEIVIVNRTLERAHELVETFRQFGPVTASEGGQINAPFDIVINATSASLQAQLPTLTLSAYAAHTFAYDMMYASEPTVFMQQAVENGAMAQDGLGMLVEQAAEAFVLWRGIRPETRSVLARLRVTLGREAAK